MPNVATLPVATLRCYDCVQDTAGVANATMRRSYVSFITDIAMD